MLTTVVKEHPGFQSSSGQFVDAKANSGEWELFAVTMQLLLKPESSKELQNRDEPCSGENSYSGLAGLELGATLLPLQNTVACIPEFDSLSGKAVKDCPEHAGQDKVTADLLSDIQATALLQPNLAQPQLGQAGLSHFIEANPGNGFLSGVNDQGFPLSSQQQEKALNPPFARGVLLQPSSFMQNEGQSPLIDGGLSGFVEAGVGPGNNSLPGVDDHVFPLSGRQQEKALNPPFARGALLQPSSFMQNDGQSPLVDGGLSRFAEAGVGQGNNSVSGSDGLVVFQVWKPVNLELEALSKAGNAGGAFQVAHVDSKSEPERVKEVSVTAEVMQVAGNEAEVDFYKDKYDPGKMEPLKSGLKAELDQAINNIIQPDTFTGVAVTPVAGTGKGARNVMSYLNDQLAQEIKMALATSKGESQTQVQLKLEPEHLGQLTIRLYFNSDEVKAHFYTANYLVKEVLESSMQQLRDSLSQQNLKLNEALVFSDGGGWGDSMGHSYQERDERAWQSCSNGYNTGYKAGLSTNGQGAASSIQARTEDYLQVNYLI
jgi:hypothetical protein